MRLVEKRSYGWPQIIETGSDTLLSEIEGYLILHKCMLVDNSRSIWWQNDIEFPRFLLSLLSTFSMAASWCDRVTVAPALESI